jgi:outer membrane lipoprotein carrier protein
MKTAKIWVLGLILFLGSYSYAEDSDKLTKLLLNIQTLQADFVQTIKDQKGKVLQQAQGHMALSRPGKFRWEVTSPNAQLVIANGSRLWIYDVDLEQVTIRNLSKATGQTPALLLSDSNLTLSKDFIVKQVANPVQLAGYVIFRLTPKDSNNLFESLKFTFIKNKIHEMQLQDKMGHTTLVTFQNVDIDKILQNSLFTLIPPKGVDVIDESHKRP